MKTCVALRFTAFVAMLAPQALEAQSIRDVAAIRVEVVDDTAFVRRLSSLEVLGEADAGDPTMFIRVLGARGPQASAECNCFLTHLYVSADSDDNALRAYSLTPLWEPKVDRISTERGRPVVYLSYGPGDARFEVRIAISLDWLVISGDVLR